MASSAQEVRRNSVYSTEDRENASLEDQTRILLARLMANGQEDEDSCKDLGRLTKLFSDDSASDVTRPDGQKPLHELVDMDGVDTIFGYLDMRQSNSVRGHATLTTSAYLKAADQTGTANLSEFFTARVGKGTYDDLILAFSVAALIFPVVPDIIASLFLTEGFVPSLGPLMKRKWKSRKVEHAALELLNAACMNTACRDAIRKHCTEWLEEMVSSRFNNHADIPASDRGPLVEDGQTRPRTHSEGVINMAAVILAKLQAVTQTPQVGAEEKIQPATTSIEDLSAMFTQMLSTGSSPQNSIEGLAYSSLQPKVKEKLAFNKDFLKTLLKTLQEAPPKSPTTYGALSILVNLTSYLPPQSDEQARMSQLKAYAAASTAPITPDPINANASVAKRCAAVFSAGVVPVLVTHSQHGSPASLSLVISILLSLSRTAVIRGQMAQQGAVKLLLHAYTVLPDSSSQAKRSAAHSLSRILISTNPSHVFGGSNPLPLTSAIRPILSLLPIDTASERLDLLPTFEALLALTNLASTSDDARNPIISTSFSEISELLLSSNTMVSRSATELICNLAPSPLCVSLYADASPEARTRLKILLALADAEDAGTRRAAGGALAGITEWDVAVKEVLENEKGVDRILILCTDEEEDIRHRGAVCALNLMTAPGEVGKLGVEKIEKANGVEILKQCVKRSHSAEVIEVAIEALKMILEAKDAAEKKQIQN